MRRQVLRGVRRRDRFFCNDKFSKTSRCSLEVSPGLMTVGRALEGGGEGRGREREEENVKEPRKVMTAYNEDNSTRFDEIFSTLTCCLPKAR